MKALLIIDIQNDFLPGGALAVKDGDAIIPIVNKIQAKFDLVIATQDWHPLNHKSFAANHENKKAFEEIMLNGSPQVLWPNHCVQGTTGANLSKDLNTNLISTIIRKGMDLEVDSYSGFFDNNKEASTGLLGLLKEKKVTDIYVCGLAADFCVYFTAKDAAEHGFKTFFIEDATRAISIEHYENLKTAKENNKIIFTTSKEL